MEDGEKVKEVIKKAVKVILKVILIVIKIVFASIIPASILLAAFVYFLTLGDGERRENDNSSVPYVVSTYVNQVTPQTDGTLKATNSAQELWDKMKANGARVEEYLDTPEELARLMKAEIVTKYPDTRSNPDKKIEWETIINNSDELQGIIKFKRGDSTLTYVDPETFNKWIKDKNKKALSYFTLNKKEDKEGYVVTIATSKQIDTTIEGNDPEVKNGKNTQYEMTTTNINYEEMVKPYTMPFDLLWSFLVVGEDKEFVFALADLIYESDIQITIHDNTVVNTDIDEWHRKEQTKAELNCVHDPWETNEYHYTKTVVTTTNTAVGILTKANVWIVDYENNDIQEENKETEEKNQITKENENYPEIPNRTGEAKKFHCEHDNQNSTIELVKYYDKDIDICDNVTNRVKAKTYTAGTPIIREKTETKGDEVNFVTLFNRQEYEKNRSNILNVASWLLELIEKNPNTKDMLDTVKYLLYKATNTDYGKTSIDLKIFYPNELISVGEGDYIVHIEKSSSNIVITDIETLRKAFKGYSGSQELEKHAQEFLDLQNQYKVNAIFAAAVSISETSAGREGHAIDGKNNWFNIECTCGGKHGRFETYTSAKQSIEEFYKQIAVKHHYFTEERYTVSEIGKIYCENSTVPGGWIDTTIGYMTQMFQAIK